MNELTIAHRQLSFIQVVIIGIAYMTPMTVFDTFGIVSDLTSGRVPLAYLLALMAIMFTARSYSRLAAFYPYSGSAYTYVDHICGSKIGFIVGWGTLLDFILLPMINSLLSGIYLKALFPNMPSWCLIFFYTVLVTIINCRNIRFLANLNFIFVGVPLILILIFIYLVVSDTTHAHGLADVLTTKPLYNGVKDIHGLISGSAVLCFSFLGFDAVATLSNETKNAQKNIPRAIVATVLCGGLIFFISAWFIQLYYPNNSQFKDPMQAMPEIVLYVGGVFFQFIFLIAILINTFASALASHASAARLLFILSTNKIIPGKLFSYLHPEYHSPFYCVLLVGFLSLSAVFFRLDTAVSLISFGAMTAFSSVNLCVFILFGLKSEQRFNIRNFYNNVLLPLAGFFTVMIMWINLKTDSLILGICWTIIGIFYLTYLVVTKKRIGEQSN